MQKIKKMVRTKMMARIVSDQRRQVARAVAAKPGPSNQRRRRQPRQRIDVKNIEGRIRSRTFKIKRLIAQPKNINVKKNGVIVRKMVAQRRAIFPAEFRSVYY